MNKETLQRIHAIAKTHKIKLTSAKVSTIKDATDKEILTKLHATS